MAVPSPSPVHVVVENMAGTSGTSIWVPLAVSLLALAGVVYTNWRTGKNLIRAENTRHKNEMRRAAREQIADAVRETYGDLEAARRELVDALADLDVHNPPSEVDDLEGWVIDLVNEDRILFEIANNKLFDARDAVTLYGAEPVREQTESVLFVCNLVSRAFDRLAASETLRDDVEHLQTVVTQLEKATDELLTLIRQELHGEAEN
ncbi:hypothetical protein ACFQ80_10910 [Isoptericola sp. NPDC056578]|uniref:hypothetical protein n=1 Tax=Isoptericola sp. NPDC056578 TaxID=3345870 RepID=UPI0036B2B001